MRRQPMLLAIAVMTATRASAQSPSDESLIRAARGQSNRAIAVHDTAGIAAAWLPEYVSVNSTNTRSIGRDSARASFAKLIATRPGVVYVRTPTTVTVNTHWGQAAESGRWSGHWKQKDGMTKVAGIYFAKWLRRNGEWKVLSETFVQTTCGGSSYCDSPP